MEAQAVETGAERRGLYAVLVLGALVRLADAALGSLHLDDFHSLFHARHVLAGAFWAPLIEDNHPPLSFAILGSFRALVGESPFLLRLPNVAYGVATIFIAWRIGRRLPGRATPTLGALAVALSSLHVELTSDLRMYGLLTLATAGLVDALLELLEEGRGGTRLALWCAVGLHTHYHFLHVLFVTGLVLGLTLILRRETRRHLRALGACFGVAALLALPWYLTGFRAQMTHGLPPGGSYVSFRTLAEGIAHLLFYRVSLGNELLRAFLLGASALSLILACVGTFARQGKSRAEARALLLPALAFLLPAWTASVAFFLPRAGFEWRYLAGAIVPFGLLVASGAAPGRAEALRRGVLALVLFAAGLNVLLVIRDPGGEDYAGAVRFILDERQPNDAVLAADWQPRNFPHSIGWSFYAPRMLAHGEALEPQLQYTDDFALVDPDRLASFPRVYCLLRSIPREVPFLRNLQREFGSEETWRFGESVFVLRFERTGSSDG